MPKTNIKDIAKALGLSVSTVSRALRDSYEISSKTKAKVLEYANKVRYKPDPIAQSLKDKNSHTICVIVPEIANNFFSQVINGIDKAAYERGYNVFVYQTYESFEKEKLGLEFGQDRRVAGFIISVSGTTDNYDHFNVLKNENIPVVYFDRVPQFDDINKVVVDNYSGAYEGTKYLIDKGKKNIAHISSYNILSVTKERIEGFKTCLKDHNIEFDEKMLKFCSFDPEDSKRAIEDLFSEFEPDGLFINSDRLSLNSLYALKRLSNVDIDNLCIVGFSNIIYPELLYPKMTSIFQPSYKIGNTSANLLIDSIEHKKKIILR